MRTTALGIPLLAAVAACGLFEPDPEPELLGCLPAYADVERTASDELARTHPLGAGVLVRVDGVTVCRLFFGSYGPDTVVPTASAAKWLTAATVLAVVDRGALTLETRAGDLFPDAPAATADITVAQLLSHTSGLQWFSRCMGRATFTLQECAQQILEGDLHFEPGTGFQYAGPPFTVAGAMAERALGQSWAEVFRTAIAIPLRLSGTSYGDSPNPALSEGDVTSTLDDYGRFAQMILDHGRWRGWPVLSPQAVDEMRRSRTEGLPIVYSPRGGIPYGLGVWLDSVDASGNGVVISSPGIGGFVPVVDFGRRMVFVFETWDDADRIWSAMVSILRAAEAAADAQP